jgi:hypothetical protein
MKKMKNPNHTIDGIANIRPIFILLAFTRRCLGVIDDTLQTLRKTVSNPCLIGRTCHIFK